MVINHKEKNNILIKPLNLNKPDKLLLNTRKR